MSLLWYRQKHKEDHREEAEESSVKVTQITHKGHITAEKADEEIVKVNKLLKADGITLKIHIATGGRHHG